MDANEEQELREIFDLVDEDKSGEISVEELQGLMRRLGINPDLVRLFVRHFHFRTAFWLTLLNGGLVIVFAQTEIELMLKEVDSDGSMEIDFEGAFSSRFRPFCWWPIFPYRDRAL